MQAFDMDNNLSSMASPQVVALLSRLKSLKDAGKYCDVVLHMGDRTVEAHKIVLAAWSPLFETVMTHKEDEDVGREHLTVACENHEDAFLQLVDFMYSGRAIVNESNVARMMTLADQFKIEPLTNVCEEFLKSNVHIKNFVTVFGLAQRFRLKSVQDNIASFVQLNLSEAAKQPEFNSLSPSWIHAFISMDSMLVLKPEYKVFLIVGWISSDFENREKYLALLFSKMTWTDLSSDFLLEISKSENFFTSNMDCLFLLLNSICKAGLPLGPYAESYQQLREKNKDGCARPQVDRVADISDDEPIAAIRLYRQGGSTAEDTTKSPTENFVPQNEDIVLESSPSEDSNMETSRDRDWSPPPTEVPDSTNKRQTRSTRRKSFPVKFTDDPDYVVPSKRRASILKQTQKKLGRSYESVSIMEKKKRGRPRKVQKDVDQDEKTVTKSERVARPPGRPRKLRSGVNGIGREKCSSGNFLKEDVPDNLSEDKPLSTRERNTWRKCDVEGCDFTATRIEHMEEHMLTVHEREQSHCCNVCDFRSSYQRIYVTHMKVHFDGPPFSCDYSPCLYKAERIQPLLTHRMIHTDERPYECNICQSKFRSPIYLQVHERTHTGERPFECEECHRCFSTKGTLDQHMISHTKTRPFLCDSCGFATKYQSHLIAHKRIHTGDVFRCRYPGCSYSTPKRSQIKAHLRSHLGIRGHTCTICGRAFVEKSHLVRHEKIHLDDKPFKCDKCAYGSTRRDKLKEHMLKHHSGNSPMQTTPYKPHKNRKTKVPLPLPTLTDSAVQLLERMVESSAPPKTGSNTAVDEDELVSNIHSLQAEQRRVEQLVRGEQGSQHPQQQQSVQILPPAQCELPQQQQQICDTLSLAQDHHHQKLDNVTFIHQGHPVHNSVVSVARTEEVPVSNSLHAGPSYTTLQAPLGASASMSTPQSLDHLQSPHMSVSILRGDGHLSQDAVAFVQSVAESVVMDTPPPIMSHNAQTTSLSHVTITTLEYIK